MKTMKVISLLSVFLLASCVSKKQIKDVILENPDIIAETIEKHPGKIMDALQKAAEKHREVMAKKKEDDEKKKFEEAFDNPLQPKLDGSETYRGSKDGPIIIVEYSDFECPFCSRGYETVMKIMDKYKGKVKFVYKHLPLSFHPNAMIASQYFEAIALQSSDKAWKFHDEIFKKQRSLKNGEKFLKAEAKKLGVNMTKLAKDINSEKVTSLIKEHMEEAKKFGIQGTPGFVLNGVPIRGAYPPDYFEMVIQKLKEKNKITL